MQRASSSAPFCGEGGTMRGILRMRLAILAVLLCCCVLEPALAQQANGTITGTIQDGTGAVIPGVTVTLSSVGLVGGNQTAISDERGVYRFTRLVPSTYSVKGE